MRKYWGIVKWVTGLGMVLLLVCGGGAVFLYPMIKKQMDAQKERARGTLVIVEPARRGSLVRTVSAPGTIAPKTTANISSRVSAKIDTIHVDVGDEVKQDQVLVELEKQDLLASLEAAKARLAAEYAQLKASEAGLAAEEARIVGSRAAYNNAVAEFERQQSLFASGDVSQQSLDNARTEVDRTQSVFTAAERNLEAVRANVDAARARAAASEAEVERAERNVDYCTIRAPFSGLITIRRANVGEMALGTIQNMGSTLLVLDDMSEVLVDVRLAETDAPRVAVGQKARIFINGFPDEVFPGVVRRVGLATQRWAQDNTFYIECEVLAELNGRRVATATTANVDLEIETIENVLMVPSQAVLDKRVDSLSQKLREESTLVDREKTFARVVMLHKDGKAVYTPVRTIAGNIADTAVAEGISEGDPIITGPFSALQNLGDGTMVRTEDEKEKDKKEGDAKDAVAEKADEKKEEKDKKEESGKKAGGASTSAG